MAETLDPSIATLVAPLVNLGLKQLRSIAEEPTTSLDDMHKALNDGLESLLALQSDKDWEVALSDIQKDPSDVFWKKRVSNIEKDVIFLNKEYDEVRGTKERILRKSLKKNIKRALDEVITLLENFRREILGDDKLPERSERVIKEMGVPSIWEYPTLKQALEDILYLLRIYGLKCLELRGQEGMEKTIIMQNLNNYFYDYGDNKEFDVVVFIKVPADEKTDLHILQKIADRIKVDREGNESEVAERIQRVLEERRYLLILDGVRNSPDGIWEKLDISNHKKDSKMVITTHYPLALRSKCVDEIVKFEMLSPTEAWKVFRDTRLPPTTKLASPREVESSSKSTSAIDKPHVLPELLRLMRIRDFIHLILSYPMRIGFEHFLNQWINDLYQLRFADDDPYFEHLLSENPLRYVHVLIPQDITKEILYKGGSLSTKTPHKHVPQPILLLATHLALHQLTLTLTSDDHIQNIRVSARNESEKQIVVDKILANSRIRASFDDLQIIDLNQIADETQRELEFSNLETKNYGRSRNLVLLVDGDGDKKINPDMVSFLIKRNSQHVLVFITTLSSNDELTEKVDLTIKTEDHLLPWEVFCRNVGSELLHSSIAIQEIAVQIVEICGGHLLAILLLAKSLKDVKDVQIWKLVLKRLLYHNREAIVNAFFHVSWANVISKQVKVRLIKCLMVFIKFREWKMSDDQLFARWLSEQLVETKNEAKGILQNFMGCSVLLQFEDIMGRHILVPEDIKIVLHAMREEIPENLSEGVLVSTISNLQVLNLSYTHMQNLYAVSTLPHIKELNLEGCTLETPPKAIFKLKKLETLSLEHCSQLLELPPQVAKLKNLKEFRLAGCGRLERLPQEIWELQKLEILSLEHCLQLQELLPQISNFENLNELRLAGCKRLATLPQEIWELPNLRTLSLPGTSIFPARENHELINSDDLTLSSSGHHEHSNKAIPSSSSVMIPNDFKLKLKVARGFNQFEQLCQKFMQLQIQNLEICDLSGTHITHLPQVLDFPKLKSLLLRNNPNLMKIPSSFFDHVPLLSILDVSRTSIHELPSSIFKLNELKEFYLKDCELFVELPTKISRLMHLTTLDLDGTLITHLPWEIRWLSNLESLSLSFYDDSDHDSSFEVIPSGFLSRLTNLKVLRIGVNSDNEWWSKNFEDILVQIYGLKMLQELDMYIPRVEFSAPMKRRLSNFRFIFGYHKPRLISHVPPAIETMFKESGRTLKFVNGEDFPHEVKNILSEARAFFLDRHMKINYLTQFGLINLKELRLCILAECNEMKSIVDVDEHLPGSGVKESFCMQYLTIFYMKNLRSIISKPILGNSIFRELKLLALHTCPELTTIFTMHSLHTFGNLEELIVEDCPKVRSIISCPSSERTKDFFLPRLRKLSLLFVPELSSISNEVCIGRNLEQIGLYYCPQLQRLSAAELSSEKLKEIRGETNWWKKLQWSKEEWGQEDPPHKFDEIFSAFDEDLDILIQLTPYELMTSFNRENDSE